MNKLDPREPVPSGFDPTFEATHGVCGIDSTMYRAFDVRYRSVAVPGGFMEVAALNARVREVHVNGELMGVVEI